MARRWEQDRRASGPVVQALTARGFSVDGGIYEGLLLTPERAEGWSPPPLSELTLDDFGLLVGLDPPPEFVILGTGVTMSFPPRALVRAFEERNIGLEVMDSRAAARTWGMLRGEDRWIGAALMPIG